MWQRKQLNLTWIMFIIDTSSQSDRLKLVELAKQFYFDTQVGGGKINSPEQLTPHPCNKAYRTIWQRKQLNLTWIMFIIDTSSHSDSLISVVLAKQFFFDNQLGGGGGQDNLAWTACPLPCNKVYWTMRRKTAEFDLNYVYNRYIFTIR